MSYHQVPTADDHDRRTSRAAGPPEQPSPDSGDELLSAAGPTGPAAPAMLKPDPSNEDEEELEVGGNDDGGGGGSTMRLAAGTAQHPTHSHFKPIKDRRKPGLASPPELTISTGTPAAPAAAAARNPTSASLRSGGAAKTGKLTSDSVKSVKCISFIKLIGVPKPAVSDDPNILATSETPLELGAGGQPMKPTAADARAADAVDTDGLSGKIVDVLDAQNDDPFTLEPFESLIRVHSDAEKDFILARVTTVDPLDETKFYYSYYAAHHINKVLFRTQPEANLLHRMKAKNPLNNMTIVGDVHYYVFTAEQGKAMGLANSKSPSRRSYESDVNGSLPSRPSRDFAGSPRWNWAAPSVGSSLRSPSAIVASLQFLLNRAPQGPPRKRLRMFVPSDLLYDMGEEGDANVKANGGDSRFKRTARRLSADDIYTGLLPPAGLLPPFAPSATPRLPALRTTAAVGVLPRSSATATATAVPMSAGVVRTSFAPRGLKHHTVRSISYMNDKEGATDPNDWVQHHLADGLDDVGWHGQRVEQQDRLTMRTLGGAVVIPGVRSAKLRTSRPAAENPPPTLSAKTKPPGSAGTTETITPVFYEFHYYGSDDDFLMKSSVRQYFKQNALEPADAVLFTISTGTTTTVPAGVDLEEHPALLGFQYAIDGPAGAEMTRFRLCSRWYVKVVVLLYIALAVVLVRFVVSDSYMYLFAFLLVFVLCFLMIFFVDILEQSRAVRNMVGSPAMESPSAVSE